jgi:hypothetical protein
LVSGFFWYRCSNNSKKSLWVVGFFILVIYWYNPYQ